MHKYVVKYIANPLLDHFATKMCKTLRWRIIEPEEQKWDGILCPPPGHGLLYNAPPAWRVSALGRLIDLYSVEIHTEIDIKNLKKLFSALSVLYYKIQDG